jgi:hypothetical protein
MKRTLDQFAAECHSIVKADPSPAGRKQICALLEEVLKEEDFVRANLADGVGTRKVLYEDPDFGFCILGHVYEGAAESSPHDHGPSWAIYGQAAGETEMTEWEVVRQATEDTPGKVRPAKTYMLKPGMAQLYNEGQLHSPRRGGPTRLIRIEGRNLDGVRRLRYEPS